MIGQGDPPMTEPLALYGAPGSPYTRKMLGVLRYRRIPYRLLLGGRMGESGMPKPKVQLLPTFYFPAADGSLEPVVDSTPIIRRLEGMYEGRSIVLPDPALEFLNQLLEDYADEWLTKAMFHYRWYYRPDTEKARRILPRWSHLKATATEIAPLEEMIADRQISRLYVVGSNDITAPVIEDAYRRFLLAFGAHMENGPYLFGTRPSAADFGMMGQLTQLALFDPTPAAVTLEVAPKVHAWTEVMEDLSGLEPRPEDWVTRAGLPETLRGLLAELGRTYVPVFLANAAALAGGAEKVETEVEGRPWVQQPFPYQGKCLLWLRQAREALSDADRRFVDEVMAGTGCERLFA
ncbi:MAG: glutathione S-transferase [Alphaproteobacteria bacterium]|nr:glutathione S-transferase [Alphaproteobacteria bacterium]